MPSFRNPQGGFSPFGGMTVSQNVPLTTETYVMPPSQRAVYFNHPATIATFTVRLPPVDDSGEGVSLKFRSIVTTLAIKNANDVTVAGAPVAATAGQVMNLRYVDPTIGWLVW